MPLPSLTPRLPDLDDVLLPTAPPALAARWRAFIAATEDRFADTCAARGEPFARHTVAELESVAHLVAATGLAPPPPDSDRPPRGTRVRQ